MEKAARFFSMPWKFTGDLNIRGNPIAAARAFGVGWKHEKNGRAGLGK